MEKCVNHPDTETPFSCTKYNVYMCVECLKCRDPEIYCKFRTSCPVWFIHKHMTPGEHGIEKEAQTYNLN
ncbi:MAG: hypothetical protein KKH68_00100 [Proteobacteria bacterium]|nr:hypothetical protein [Pseudomonadota bacterium]